MSCASPVSQMSPHSLHMHINAKNLLSPSCRCNVDDDPPFSFAFPPSSLSSPSSPAASPAKSRPALTDILLQRHTNSLRSPLHRAAALVSSRNCAKENCSNADIEAFRTSPGKETRASHQSLFFLSSPRCQPKSSKRSLENEVPAGFLCSTPSPRQPTGRAEAMTYTPPLPSPKSCGRDDPRVDVKHDVESDALCFSRSPSPLKRRRPAKLSIPEFARLASFGKAKQFELPASEPLSSKILSFEAPLFGVSCQKGRRDCMEDAHTALTNFQGKANQAFFGVFDGHGGKSAAQFAAKNLAQHIAAAIENASDNKESLESAMQAGYLAMDSEFLDKGLESGACSISAYVKEGHLVVANAGDCKAVLCREGKAEALSNLHRPGNVEERQRIESLGGYVDCFNGVWRVQGTLAVTRGFGDTNLKKWISSEPEVRQLDITKDCEFLILASDGLWDKVSDQEAVDCIREGLERGTQQALDSPAVSRPCKVLRKDTDTSIIVNRHADKSESVGSLKADACTKLIHKACNRGNLDDITVMVIPLANFALPISV